MKVEWDEGGTRVGWDEGGTAAERVAVCSGTAASERDMYPEAALRTGEVHSSGGGEGTCWSMKCVEV